MAYLLKVVCFALAFSAPVFAATTGRFPGPGSHAAFVYPSANGEYWATLKEADPTANDDQQILLVSVAKSPVTKWEILWTNSVSGFNSFLPGDPFAITLADDGSCLIVRSERDTWELVARNRPTRALAITNRASSIHLGRFSPDNALIYFDQFAGQSIVRIWRRDPDLWQGFFINEDKAVQATPDLIAKWNEETRAKILEEIARARTESLKRKLYEISPTLGNMANDPKARWRRDRPRMIHYEFLALRRVPQDRVIFEDLLQHKAPGPVPTNYPASMRAQWAGYSVLSGGAYFHARGIEPYVYESHSHDRHEGDWLLAIFDQNPQIKTRDRNAVDREMFYLGRLKGAVELPLPIVNKAGVIRIYLAPENRAGRDWNGDGIDKIEEELIQETRRKWPLTSTVKFTFDTVSPGRVRLKAIWDRRPQFDDTQKAGPGDYESGWSAPILITPGVTITNVVLVCTNRAASGGESYYAADEMRARRWHEQGEAAFAPPPEIPRDTTEMFSADGARWLAATNFQSPRYRHGLFQVSIVHKSDDTEKTPELLAIFAKATPWNDVIDHFTMRLEDESGFAYAASFTQSSGHFTYVTFPQFPQGAKTFHLVGYGPPENLTAEHSFDPLFDLTLTNLWLTGVKR